MYFAEKDDMILPQNHLPCKGEEKEGSHERTAF